MWCEFGPVTLKMLHRVAGEGRLGVLQGYLTYTLHPEPYIPYHAKAAVVARMQALRLPHAVDFSALCGAKLVT
jgi:hypothetical protein